MNFKEYVEKLNKFIKDNPETEVLTVVYSKDDEGNGFQELCNYYDPAIGLFEDFEFNECDKPNAICIN